MIHLTTCDPPQVLGRGDIGVGEMLVSTHTLRVTHNTPRSRWYWCTPWYVVIRITLHNALRVTLPTRCRCPRADRDLPDGPDPGILAEGWIWRVPIKLKSTAYARARKLILYTSGSGPHHPDVHQADIGILDRLEYRWYS